MADLHEVHGHEKQGKIDSKSKPMACWLTIRFGRLMSAIFMGPETSEYGVHIINRHTSFRCFANGVELL